MPLRQGDVLAVLNQIPEFTGIARMVEWQDAPLGVVVVSQTCDAIRDSCIQVAPIVELEGDLARQAQVGRRPQYAPLAENSGNSKFADLSHILTINRGQVMKSTENSMPSPEGFVSAVAEKLFRNFVGRRFARFPFPDEVTDWCRPLTDKVAPKARHADTKPEGARLDEIKEIRVAASSGWSQPPFHLQLDFLVEPGILPEPDRDLANAERERLLSMPASSLAAEVDTLRHSADEGAATMRAFAWNQLITCWVKSCNGKYNQERNNGVQVHGDGQLWDLDDYPYSRALRSERLDLDYLSRSSE
jgi:hypothetical protein